MSTGNVAAACDNEASPRGGGTPPRALTHRLDSGERGLAVKATQLCSIQDCERPRHGRGWCMLHYRRWSVSGDPNYVRPKRPTVCTVDGCENPARSSVHCQMHRFRLQRNGSLDLPERAGRHAHSAGYIVVRRPGHPLAQPRHKYWVYEHRVVLFDAIGPGWHDCYHCGMAVSWELTYPEHLDALVVDHLDDDRANNDRSNLVPSCSPCNGGRANRKRAKGVS